MADIPFAPPVLYGHRPSASIRDLIMMGGQERARAAERSGEIWANALGGVGQAVAGGFQAYGEQKAEEKRQQAMAKRDQAAVDFVSSWQGDDPAELVKGLAKIGGLEYAAKFGPVAQALKSKPTEDAKTELQGMYVWGKMLTDPNVPDATKATIWEGGKARFGPIATSKGLVSGEMLQGDWTPEHAAGIGAFVGPLGQVLGIKEGEAKAPKLTNVEVAGPDGKPMLKGFTDEQVAAGVPKYVEPPKPKEPEKRAFQSKDVLDDDGQPVVASFDPGSGRYTKPDGTIIKNPRPVPSGSEQKATAAERKVLQFYERGKRALENIAPVDEQIEKAGGWDQLVLQYGPNFSQSDIQQKYRQAQRAFTEARLRKESGAAIPKEEYENDARTYFAQPGDLPGVAEQKRKDREGVLSGMAFESGKAFEERFGKPMEAGPAAMPSQVGRFKIKRK